MVVKIFLLIMVLIEIDKCVAE